ncbi:MAG: PspC domain-containing protein [Kineothrix sp.]|nr:PspC domain-containing protein [Kineothrix sp.]NBI91781.1 PspC domain-containing protein [Lachnospiraceae bacterium]
MERNYKKLIRSKGNRMICGVCGGIGEYVGIDPTLVRIIWVVLSIAGWGTGLVAYLIAAIIIPEEV